MKKTKFPPLKPGDRVYLLDYNPEEQFRHFHILRRPRNDRVAGVDAHTKQQNDDAEV